MALDKVLKIYDEQGNPVDYDILASDIKFLPDGKDLPTKLTEMEDAIEDAAESGGYTPPQGGIPKTDLAPSVQTSLGLANTALQEADKIQLQAAINAVQTALNNLMNGQSVTDAIDTFNEVVDFLDDIDTDDPTLFNQLLALNNDISALQSTVAGKISGIKADGASETLPVDENGIVTLPPAGSTISPATATPSMNGPGSVGSSDKYAREDHVHPCDTSKVSTTDIADNLTTDNASKVLSAKQGKKLNDEKQDKLTVSDTLATINGSALHYGDNLTITGKSAYQSYVDTTSDDPVKTEAQWIASLKGPQGDPGNALLVDGEFDPVTDIINNLTSGGTDKALSAEMGKTLKGLINNIHAENVVDVAEDGFYLIDADGNVVAQYTDDGWRVAELDPAYIAMLNRNISVEIGTTTGTAYDGGSGHELEQRVDFLETKVGNTSLCEAYWLETMVVTASSRPNHDCTWVGDEFWSFDKPTDGGRLSIYNTSFELQASKTATFYEAWKNGTTNNQLEMKGVDYKNGFLMVSNGKGSYSQDDSYAYIFYDFADWKTASSVITFENCGDYTKIDFTELGYKCYTFFGSQPELVFVCTNLFGKVTLVRLGKGTNELEKGTYTAADPDKFNGTWVAIKTWVQSPLLTSECAPHGGQYYNGSLYLANNQGYKCEVYRCVLNDSGKLQFDVLHLEQYNDNGTFLYCDIDGMAIKDGILYAQPLYMNNRASTTNAIIKANINIL